MMRIDHLLTRFLIMELIPLNRGVFAETAAKLKDSKSDVLDEDPMLSDKDRDEVSDMQF